MRVFRRYRSRSNISFGFMVRSFAFLLTGEVFLLSRSSPLAYHRIAELVMTAHNGVAVSAPTFLNKRVSANPVGG